MQANARGPPGTDQNTTFQFIQKPPLKPSSIGVDSGPRGAKQEKESMTDFKCDLYSGKQSAEIQVADSIGKKPDGSGVSAADLIKRISRLPGSSAIVVRITTTGGSIHDSVAIYEALQRHPGKVTTVGTSLVASAGVIIFCAGDERLLSPGTELMFHAASMRTSGTVQQLRTRADALERTEASVVELFAKTTGLSKSAIRDLMAVETWKNAQESVKLGFAHRIVSSDSPQMQLDPDRLASFQNVPACMADLVRLPEQKRVTPMLYAMACAEIDKRELIAKR